MYFGYSHRGHYDERGVRLEKQHASKLSKAAIVSLNKKYKEEERDDWSPRPPKKHSTLISRDSKKSAALIFLKVRFRRV